jgi:hypothetical protein
VVGKRKYRDWRDAPDIVYVEPEDVATSRIARSDHQVNGVPIKYAGSANDFQRVNPAYWQDYRWVDVERLRREQRIDEANRALFAINADWGVN